MENNLIIELAVAGELFVLISFLVYFCSNRNAGGGYGGGDGDYGPDDGDGGS